MPVPLYSGLTRSLGRKQICHGQGEGLSQGNLQKPGQPSLCPISATPQALNALFMPGEDGSTQVRYQVCQEHCCRHIMQSEGPELATGVV